MTPASSIRLQFSQFHLYKKRIILGSNRNRFGSKVKHDGVIMGTMWGQALWLREHLSVLLEEALNMEIDLLSQLSRWFLHQVYEGPLLSKSLLLANFPSTMNLVLLSPLSMTSNVCYPRFGVKKLPKLCYT